ncbi:hypothetical protein SAMN05444156_0754 [Verrucomicrobium sp. GAS474]|uniref:hypothetical protein n=1 Tax=Verrucomicrobium sp. GAS474 TaxID=1882831 RepID=UPI00087DC1F9|nr:hypothetical protein [Verrucomicrobium sp. GAS474]SDT92081.1 hypothetical protein SAMN05444156_0754 [Verrucomicrobium sp. GAS474]
MKTRLPLILGSVAILLVGVALGWWITLHLPPPLLPPVPWTGPGAPPRPGDAARDDRDKDKDKNRRPAPTAEQIAKLRAEMAEIEPELAAFQKDYLALTKDYDDRFAALLTDEQKKLREQMRGPGGGGSGGVDWIAEFHGLAENRLGPQAQQAQPAPFGAAPGAAGDNDGRTRRRQQERLFRALLHIVMYEPFLRLTADSFHLTPEQTAATEKLMEARRVAFLKLADTHPLPFDRLFLSLRNLGFLPPPPALPAPAKP